jgi:hypothetical protein
MSGGGKDIKIGDDKRRISIVPSNQQDLYNISNGELLTDEFGNTLITEVDTYYTLDASKKRSTSVVFNDRDAAYTRLQFQQVGIATAVYGDLDVDVSTGVGVTSGSTVGFGTTVSTVSSGAVTLAEYPYLEVRVVDRVTLQGNKIYFDDSISNLDIRVGDQIDGPDIPDGTFISRIVGLGNTYTAFLSNNISSSQVQSAQVLIKRATEATRKSDIVWKIEEQFKEQSEVSTTLLGVNRLEVQLALFSNVSSYGLDPDEFEFYSYDSGVSFGSWDNRGNEIYGNRYDATRTEEIQESAIKITAFPVPYSFPFGPKFEKLGLYDNTRFSQYINFIQLGNDLYNYFNGAGGTAYPSDWKDKFLSPSFAYIFGGDVVYAAGTEAAFRQIDTWTDTWRDIKDSLLVDPVTGNNFTFTTIILLLNYYVDSTTTRPGYSDSDQRYAYLQSRRVFRYQPGRISGFTFGLRSSTEPVTGITLEWGISNPTDQYVFRIDAGQFYIVRRSTIPLESSALARSGLTIADQTRIVSGDPFDDTEYWTIQIPRDKFNGDPLNSNGPSGYLLNPEKVTMYKIEFGWYGAIGARFYAYIPTDNGDARWVVIHTLVIENSLGSPCLQDSYFRFKYALNIANTGDVRTPQYIYKYGASYYIDGGDEGTSQIYSASSKQRTISSSKVKSLLGVTPKDFILNRDGVPIQNKKIIVPTELNVSTDSLTEVKVVTCTACPGFGHVYTPGIAKTESGRYLDIQFSDPNTITTVGVSSFTADDVGAKIIAPSIYNAYITSVNVNTQTATVKGFGGLASFSLTDRNIGSPSNVVYDRVLGITTTIGIGVTYPHQIRLSNYDCYAASDFGFTGSTLEIQFVNPRSADNYEHFADFLIGITDKKPDVSLPDTLNGFIIPGVGTTTILANSDILYGEHTHSYTAANEDGVETAEGWAPQQPSIRMGIDYRIPSLASPAGGICSKATVTVEDPLQIPDVNEYNVNPKTGLSDGNLYVQIQGTFPAIDYNGGQIAILQTGGTVNVTNSRFVGVTSSYFSSGNTYSYIQIDQTLSAGSNFTILIRPINVTAEGSVNSTKLYNYNPYPLYLVAKLRDYAQINNISVKETIGDLQRTVSPKWYILGDAIEVTNADGNADTTGVSPTNFNEITRLSSALIDVQNDQSLRPYTERDTLYIGANSTETIDMSKIFGPEKRVITPDNNNLEATFITAKKIDGGGSGTAEVSLNFKEQ